jgi:hypothetical protein
MNCVLVSRLRVSGSFVIAFAHYRLPPCGRAEVMGPIIFYMLMYYSLTQVLKQRFPEN